MVHRALSLGLKTHTQFHVLLQARRSWSWVNTPVDRAPCRAVLAVCSGGRGLCQDYIFTRPWEEQAASADLWAFFPLMKLRQRPLSCSLSAAGVICVRVLCQSKSSRGSGPVWTQHSEWLTGVLMKIKALMFTEQRYLTHISCNLTTVQTNVHALCTHDYQLKDPVLIRLEFVCSPTVWAPGCRVNGFSEGLSSLARVQLSCCLDSVMCNATMAVLSGSCEHWEYTIH